MKAKTIKENFGGAGYAVYGGNATGGYGNGIGRGNGFGGSSNNGGPNLMYIYSIKPLDQLLQQPGTPQGDERYIHAGSEVKGRVLGKKKEIVGKVIGVKEDGKGNILHYTVQEFKTALKFNLDPTSLTLITHEEIPNMAGRDIVPSIGEEFCPSLKNFLKESNKK